MGTQVYSEPQAPASAVRIIFGNQRIGAGSGTAERLGFIAKILVANAAAVEEGLGADGPFNSLVSSLHAPAATPQNDMVLRARWVLPTFSPFESVILLSGGGTVLLFALDRQRDVAPIALVDFGKKFDEGHNHFTFDDQVVTEVLNAMPDFTRFECLTFRLVEGDRWKWNGGFRLPDQGCCSGLHDSEWVSTLEPAIDSFRPDFQGVPNL